MASIVHRNDVASGVWRILDPTVSREELARFVKGWMEDPHNYEASKELKAHVRRHSGGRDASGQERPVLWGVQFVFNYGDVVVAPTANGVVLKDQYTLWFYRFKSQLIRTFGEDNVKWDIDREGVIEITAG